MEDERNRFERRVNFRLFEEEYKKLCKAILHSKDEEGFRKYDSESHFCRCAIMKALREDLPKLEVKKGRPKKLK